MAGREANEPPRQRRELLYSGRVQGVGFRYTTCEIAGRFRVAGYVQNLPDGSVKLVAEGEAVELERFLDAVGEELARYIANTQTRTGQTTGEYADFRIKH